MLERITGKHRKEMVIVGQLLCSYTQLEFQLMNCIEVVVNDYNSVFKSLFRTRGETQRIEIADAMGRTKFHDIKLGTHFEMAVGAVRHCMKIRNQYSHCQWHGTKILEFSDLEVLARSHALVHDKSEFPSHEINFALLIQQERYFHHTATLLLWLEDRARVKLNRPSEYRLPKPKQLKPPPLYIGQG